MRPQRLPGFSYVGVLRYFLTISTRERRQLFSDGAIAATTVSQFRHIAREEGFAILAYCLMPDHAHFLVEGMTAQSDFRRFVKRAKQHSSAAYALQWGRPLWQRGYYERVLRRDTDAREVARYVLWNPVRTGLVLKPAEYPHLGSEVWRVEDLME